MNPRERYSLRADMTPRFKQALVILLEDGGAEWCATYWRGRSGRQIALRTICALYDRYLIRIVTESRHRRRQTASLTEVGDYAAREIRRKMETGRARTRELAPQP